MLKVLNVSDLASLAGVKRTWIHKLLDDKRIRPDIIHEARDGTRMYFFKVATAEYYAEKIKSQRKLPSRIRRKYE